MPKAVDIPEATRRRVLERDNHRCRWCGRSNGGLHLHHIVYRSNDRNNHADENLVSLCPDHHLLVHTNKRYYQPILEQLVAEGPPQTGIALVRRLRRASEQ